MTDSEPSKKELLERIEQLEKQQEKLTQGAVDSQGRRWTLSDFLNMGLKRRQAIKAISLVAGGASIGAAVMRSVSAAPGDDGDTVWGSSSNRDDYYADELDANLVRAEDGVLGGFDFWKEVDDVSVDSATAQTLDLGGTVSSGDAILLDIDHIFHNSSAGDVTLSFDSATSGGLGYELRDGTGSDSADHWVLYSGDAFSYVSGQLLIVSEGYSDYLGASGDLILNRWSRNASVLSKAGSNESVEPTQMTIEDQQGDGLYMTATVYRRDIH